MIRRATLRWFALALAGLLLAGGIAALGSSLVSRQIGLASEPIRAGDALAPPTRTESTKPREPKAPAGQPQPAEPAEPPQPAEQPAPSEPAEPGAIGSDGEGGDD